MRVEEAAGWARFPVIAIAAKIQSRCLPGAILPARLPGLLSHYRGSRLLHLFVLTPAHSTAPAPTPAADIMCAPLWDAAKGGYAGLLTSSDLCDILRIFYTPGTAASALSELTIAAWREYAGSLEGLRRGLSSPQLYASPQQLAAVNDSIAAAAAPGSARAAGGAGGGRSGRHRSSISGAKRRRRIGGGSGGTDGALSDAGTIEELDDEDDDDGDDGMEGGASDGEGDDAMGGIGPTVSSASGSGARSRLNSSSSSASASAGVPRLSPRDVHMSGGGGMLQSPSLAAGFSPGGGRGQQHAGPWRGSRSGTVDSLGGALSTPRPGPELTAASRSSSGSSAGAGQLAVLSLGGSSAATGDASQAHSIATASSVTAGGSTSVSLSAGGGGGDPSSASVAMGGGQGGAAGVTPPGPHASGRRGRSGTVGSTGTGSPAVARRKRAVRRPPPRLVSIHPEDDLLTVSRKLRAFNIHHMPVHDPDTDAVIGVLSHRSLMAHVIARYCDATVALEQPLCSIGVGSFADIVVVPETASVISVLHVLAERQISSVPIVNPDSGALVDVYCRDDVAFLANDPSLMVLDAPVGDVRRAQAQMVGGRGCAAGPSSGSVLVTGATDLTLSPLSSPPFTDPLPSRPLPDPASLPSSADGRGGPTAHV